mmetsp:Transcript_2382/g.5714  ORF Transcript_2382/g.5714 Transcript_2382/m.5714 type:complete len:200 (+) Transcript_2382:870-1469(+)
MMRTPADTSAYACSSVRSLPYSRLTLRVNSLCRTGSVEKIRRRVTVVPTARATVSCRAMPPRWSYSSRVPASSRSVRVVTERSDNAQSDDSASPRNPNDASAKRSSNSLILDVAYFCVSAAYPLSSGETPAPLSTTSMHSAPCSFSRTSTLVAPASSAFSTSSFTAPARSSTTCPLQMRWMASCEMGTMALAIFCEASF